MFAYGWAVAGVAAAHAWQTGFGVSPNWLWRGGADVRSMVFKISGVAMGVGRHTLYNLAGSIVPMLPALITVPIYLHLVGATRYGVLALVWTLLGYFGLFDPGLSRAAAYHIAKLRDAPAKDRESVFWTVMVVNLGLGCAGGVVFYLVARPLSIWAFKMPEAMRAEVIASLPWLAASIPVAIATGVLGSVLQARQWFGVSNALNTCAGVVTQSVPLAVAYFHGPDLAWLIPAILLARSTVAIPAFLAVARALPLGCGGRFERSLLRKLFSYGGWTAVSHLILQVLNTTDRILIGSVLSVQAVAFYTVPFFLVARMSIIPGALSNSLFPRLSGSASREGAWLASRAVAALAAVMTPLVVIGILALPVFMRLWVGPAFAAHATPVGIILLLGIWINGLSYIPYIHLQANNRPDLIAIFHLAELLPFLAILWVGLHEFGLIGAAWAWTLRVSADAALLFAVAGQLAGWQKLLPGIAIVVIAALCAPYQIISYQTLSAAILIIATSIWSWQVSPEIRDAFKKQFGRLTLRST